MEIVFQPFGKVAFILLAYQHMKSVVIWLFSIMIDTLDVGTVHNLEPHYCFSYNNCFINKLYYVSTILI